MTFFLSLKSTFPKKKVLGKTLYLSSGYLMATYWWPERISMYQTPVLSAIVTILPSAAPCFLTISAMSSTPSRAVLTCGKTTVVIIDSAKPFFT